MTALLFTAGMTALLLIFSYIFMPKNNMKDHGMEESRANGILGEKNNTIDILVIGDSESYTSIIPLHIWRDTGYTSYICGTGGQTLDYTEVMLKRCFQYQTPKIVILETNAIYRDQTWENLAYTKICNLFPVFRYHNRWKRLEWRDFYQPVEFTWTDDQKGFQFSTQIQSGTNTDHMKSSKKAALIPETNLFCLKSIKQLCDENGARLLLLSTPSIVNWNDARHKGISELAEELNCDYIDMNLLVKEIPIDWNKDTKDKGDHFSFSSFFSSSPE